MDLDCRLPGPIWIRENKEKQDDSRRDFPSTKSTSIQGGRRIAMWYDILDFLEGFDAVAKASTVHESLNSRGRIGASVREYLPD
jgi:hypothetical protein